MALPVRRNTDPGDSHLYLPDDVVILVLGVTGSGKSTFINDVIGCSKAKVSHTMKSAEARVTSYLACLPKDSRYPQHKSSRLILVDTPGFDGGHGDDSDTLLRVRGWINQKYGNGKKFSGIIYLHSVAEKRIRYNTALNFSSLERLCGENPETKIVMATTHWNDVSLSDGVNRENELRESFWNGILNGNNTNMMRLELATKQLDTYRAIDFILGVTPPPTGETWKRGNDRWRSKIVSKDDVFFNDGHVDDLIIAIIGPTGVGKSTFLNHAARLYAEDRVNFKDPSQVGHSLESCTQNVVHHTATLPRDHPLFPGRRIVFVDTPGFGDTHQTESEILRRIAAWLANSYSRNIYLAGLIYLSDISRVRMPHSERWSLDVFHKACGKDFTRVVIASTHWDIIQPQDGEKREESLKQSFWRELIDQGATIYRVTKTPDDVAVIIEGILQQFALEPGAQVLQIQSELVDMEKTIPLTEAGTKLRHSLQELVELRKHQLQRSQTTLTPLEQQQLKREITLALGQIEQLRVTVTDRVKHWLLRNWPWLAPQVFAHYGKDPGDRLRQSDHSTPLSNTLPDGKTSSINSVS